MQRARVGMGSPWPLGRHNMENFEVDALDVLNAYYLRGERVDEVLYQIVKTEIETLRQQVAEEK